jgi:hypothetical protein
VVRNWSGFCLPFLIDGEMDKIGNQVGAVCIYFSRRVESISRMYLCSMSDQDMKSYFTVAEMGEVTA